MDGSEIIGNQPDVGMISPGIFYRFFQKHPLHQLVQFGISEPSTVFYSWRICFGHQTKESPYEPNQGEMNESEFNESNLTTVTWLGPNPVGNLGMVSTPTRVAEVVGSGNTLCLKGEIFLSTQFFGLI